MLHMKNILHTFRFAAVLATLLVALMPTMSWAATLPEAKAAGMVGEMPDGYLGVVKASPEAEALVADINAKRKAAYEGIASKTGQAVEIVEKLAGEKALNKTEPGNYIKYPDGTWHKK